MKIPTDKHASGTVIQENAKDKRSKEELQEFVENQEDIDFMHKVI